jgi:ABC-type Fe3+-siderophore transport system permease subunit
MCIHKHVISDLFQLISRLRTFAAPIYFWFVPIARQKAREAKLYRFCNFSLFFLYLPFVAVALASTFLGWLVAEDWHSQSRLCRCETLSLSLSARILLFLLFRTFTRSVQIPRHSSQPLYLSPSRGYIFGTLKKSRWHTVPRLASPSFPASLFLSLFARALTCERMEGRTRI